MRAILSCGCGNTSAYAVDVFKMLFKGLEAPRVIEVNISNYPLFEFALETIGAKDRYPLDKPFAIYLRTEEDDTDGVIIMATDLLTGEVIL